VLAAEIEARFVGFSFFGMNRYKPFSGRNFSTLFPGKGNDFLTGVSTVVDFVTHRKTSFHTGASSSLLILI
jgi:hypothetical protein